MIRETDLFKVDDCFPFFFCESPTRDLQFSLLVLRSLQRKEISFECQGNEIRNMPKFIISCNPKTDKILLPLKNKKCCWT
jgi:hypothetical protein